MLLRIVACGPRSSCVDASRGSGPRPVVQRVPLPRGGFSRLTVRAVRTATGR